MRFPDLERLAPRLRARLGGVIKPRVEAHCLLAFAKLEKIIFGDISAETAAALAHWLAECAKARAEAVKKRRDGLRLEEPNAGRKVAGLRGFYSLDDAERTLEREREEAERLSAPPPVAAADVAAGDYDQDAAPWWLPRTAGGTSPGVPPPDSEAERALLEVCAKWSAPPPDPAGRYYSPEMPAPARRYSAGGSAPARRYRPRT